MVPEASRVTTCPRVCVWSGPALATTPAGGRTVEPWLTADAPPGPVTVSVTVAAPLVAGVQLARPRVVGEMVPLLVVQA